MATQFSQQQGYGSPPPPWIGNGQMPHHQQRSRGQFQPQPPGWRYPPPVVPPLEFYNREAFMRPLSEDLSTGAACSLWSFALRIFNFIWNMIRYILFNHRDESVISESRQMMQQPTVQTIQQAQPVKPTPIPTMVLTSNNVVAQALPPQPIQTNPLIVIKPLPQP